MASITLNPGESFEHIHTTESITTHVEGMLELLIEDKRIQLRINEAVVIPPMVTHTIVNIGSSIAIFDCNGHATTGTK